MKFFTKTLLALVALMMTGISAKAVGWPANYEGVMLQGFYWDSYSETSWSKLTARADELSKYFKLIWVPNSAQSAGMPTMGYMPIYYFTHHSCSFGTEAELKTMISTFKSKGTGFIEDVVVNHRVGVSNWADFPTETWKGVTYKMDASSVCRTDEWGQGTGAADTGEDFNGARDLDHTNANVQNVVKNYCKFLLEDLGYVGFRLDMVKGYGGQYTKIYNQYSKPTYSVGEYWDGSYDAVARWIDATGKESAAFDFPCKYNMHEAFNSNDMRKLAWKNPDGADQPGGMIHFGYNQLAVTFVDNHDTYRDGSKFPQDNNVMAANAFILFSPGTPCIFWPHYEKNKLAMQALIDARNAVGIHNCSPVKVVKLESNCYAAEITGTKGKAVVKIGSDTSYNPGSNYTIKASGNNYCVWTTAQGGQPGTGGDLGGGSGSAPSKLYVLGNLQGSDWNTSNGVALTKSGNTFTGNITLVGSNDGSSYFTFVTALGSDWDAVNSSDRYGSSAKDEAYTPGSKATLVAYPANVSASGANSWKTTPGTYSVTVDFDNMTMMLSNGTGGGGNQGGGDTGNSDWTIYFDNSNSNWSTVKVYAYGTSEAFGTWSGTAMTKDSASGYFKLTTKTDLTGLNLIFNNGGDQQTGDNVKAVNNGIYKFTSNKGSDGVYVGVYTGGNQGGGNQGGGDTTEPKTVYLVGANNDWTPGDASLKMTYQGNNVWTYTGSNIFTGEWKICDGTWNWSFGMSDDIVADVDNDTWFDGQNFKAISTGSNVTLTFTLVAGSDVKNSSIPSKVKYTAGGNQGGGNQGGGEDDGNGAKLYLVGDFNEWTNPGQAFTYEGNNTYTLKMASLNGQFKVNDGTWTGINLGGDGQGADVPSVDAIMGDNTLWQGSSVNLAASNLTNVVLTLTYVKGGESATLNISADGGQGGGNQGGGDVADMPSVLYLMGNVGGESNHWAAHYGIQMIKEGNTFVADNVELQDGSLGAGNPASYFSFVTVLGTDAKDWDGEYGVNSGHRFGAEAGDTPLALGGTAKLVKYAAGVDASAAASWKVTPGTYKVTADFANGVVKLDKATSVEIVESEDVAPVYYNLQGVRVDNPTQGLYIVVRGNKVTKEIVR